MKIEEIETRIAKVEKIKAFLEKDRNAWLDNHTWDGFADRVALDGYLNAVQGIETCEKELKRLGSEKVHIMIGNPPYDGDES